MCLSLSSSLCTVGWHHRLPEIDGSSWKETEFLDGPVSSVFPRLCSGQTQLMPLSQTPRERREAERREAGRREGETEEGWKGWRDGGRQIEKQDDGLG